MKLLLSYVERPLLEQSLLDVIINSDNFDTIEKNVLEDIYKRIRNYEGKTQLALTYQEVELLKRSVLDTKNNSNNFVTIEKDILEGICKCINDYEEETGNV